MSDREMVDIRQCVMRMRDGTEVRWLQGGYWNAKTELVEWRDVREYHVPMPESPS